MTRRAGLSLTSIPGCELIDLFDLPGLGAADRRVIVLRTLFRGFKGAISAGISSHMEMDHSRVATWRIFQ